MDCCSKCGSSNITEELWQDQLTVSCLDCYYEEEFLIDEDEYLEDDSE
jgi:hypothetical protein